MTKKPWALLTSDWHLRIGNRVWTNQPYLYGDVEYGLRQVKDYLYKYRTPLVLLAGDITDTPHVDTEVMRQLLDFGNACADTGAAICYVRGQHDAATPPVMSLASNNSVNINGLKVEIADISMYGLDYYRPRLIKERLDAAESADILVAHQPWNELMGEYGTAELPTRYRLVCSGDYHCNCTYKKKKTTLLSPGTLCMQKISETGKHGIWLIYDDLSFELLPLKSRGFYEYVLNDEDDVEELLVNWQQFDASQPQQDVPADIRKNIVRITHNPFLRNLDARVSGVIGDDVYLFFKVGRVNVVEEQRIIPADYNINKMLESIYSNDCRLGDAKKLLRAKTTSQINEIIDEVCHRIREGEEEESLHE